MTGWLEFFLFFGLFIGLSNIRSDIEALQKQITTLINDIANLKYSIDRGIDKSGQDSAMLSESTNSNPAALWMDIMDMAKKLDMAKK
jgi:hypothetical protein